MDACPHCVGTADVAKLSRLPLWALTPNELERYAWKAMTTWGDVDDYRHFLPRLCELAVGPTVRAWYALDCDGLLGKLAYGSWRTWPEAERRALDTYFELMFMARLAEAPQLDDAYTLLTALLGADGPLEPLLERWAAEPSLNAALHLARLIDEYGTALQTGRRFAPRLAAWLRDPARRTMLERAFEANVDDPSAPQLAAAVDTWNLVAG